MTWMKYKHISMTHKHNITSNQIPTSGITWRDSHMFELWQEAYTPIARTFSLEVGQYLEDQVHQKFAKKIEVLISMIESCKREDDLREYLREKLLNLLAGLPCNLQLAGVSCKCFFAGK